MAYRLRKFKRGKALEDKSTKYSLVLIDDEIDLGRVHFVNWNKADPRFPETGIPITGRSLTEYAKHLPNLVISPKLQYVEVGAGLGEFIPALAERFNEKIRPPIIIDPANYPLMREMLEYVLGKNLTDAKQTERAKAFLERIKIITNPDKVRLYNKTLGRAIHENPELIGCADAVLDFTGPKIYSETEIRKDDKFNSGKELKQRLELRIKLYEMMLLKSNGKRILAR